MEELNFFMSNISILGNKWVTAILLVLFLYELTRFSQIKKTLKMNPKTLSRKLSLLVTLGMVDKVKGSKKSQEYMLTDIGRQVCHYLLKIRGIVEGH